MIWEARQRRLKDILGAQNNFCFQVYAVITQPKITDPHEVCQFLEKHNVSPNAASIGYLPPQKFGSFEVDAGWYSMVENSPAVMPKVIKPLYALAPFNARPSEAKSHAEESLQTIREQYIPEIENQYTDLKVNELGHIVNSADGRCMVKFIYSLQPYTPSVCHPRDLGVLQPVTLFDDHVTIRPSVPSIPDFKTLNTHIRRSPIGCKPSQPI